MKKEVAVQPSARGVKDIAKGKKQKNDVPGSRIQRWGITRIVALADCGITVHKTYLEKPFVIIVVGLLKLNL